MKKIGGIAPDIFDVFSFSVQPIIHLEKEEPVVQQAPVVSHIICGPRVLLS